MLPLIQVAYFMPECQSFRTALKPAFLKNWPGLDQNRWPTLLRNEWPTLLRNEWPTLVQNHWPTIVQNSHPEVDRVMEVVNALNANAGNIHNGGCGYFAIMLQELIGGKIYHLTYMIREGMVYNFTPGHNFVIKGEYCYDYNGVCRTVTLFREKKITKAYNFTQFQHIPRRDHYVLFNNDANSIQKDYKAGGFYGDFSKGQLKRLQSNFASLKRNPALESYQATFNNKTYKSVA